MSSRHRVGDIARVLKEALAVHRRPVALATVTGPGTLGRPCPCGCGQVVVWDGDVSAWNLSAAHRWDLLRHRIARELDRVYGLRPPRCVARVAQRQARGMDHLHLVWLCSGPHDRERIARWVEVYRRLHAGYGFGFVDDPLRVRRMGRDMVVAEAVRLGAYLGRYLAGGQLERYLEAEDRSWRPVWVSPVLMQRSGWNLTTCKRVRQAYAIVSGQWKHGWEWSFGRWRPAVKLPAWCSDLFELARIEALLGWPEWGLVTACAGYLANPPPLPTL